MWVMTHDVSVFNILYCVILQVNDLESPHFDIISGLEQIINFKIIQNCFCKTFTLFLYYLCVNKMQIFVSI
jgi:hypothetical protein